MINPYFYRSLIAVGDIVLFLFADLLHHFLYGCFQLSVIAVEEILRCVIYGDVRVQLSVLCIFSVESHTSHLRNSEYHGVVDHRLPPYGSHCACHWSTDELADAESLVYHRESVAVAVVVFADEHTRRFCPFVERVAADIVASWHEILVFLAVEQSTQIVVQPSSTIVTVVNDDSLTVGFLSLRSSRYTVRKLSLFIAFTCT